MPRQRNLSLTFNWYVDVQTEQALEQQEVKTATKSYASPPTAILGFAPPSQGSPALTPVSSKHSWPASFLDSTNAKKKRPAQLTSSAHDSEFDEVQQLASADSGAESSHKVAAEGAAGDDNGDGNDYGAAWRDAAESPTASPLLAPAADTGIGQSLCHTLSALSCCFQPALACHVKRAKMLLVSF